MTPTRIDFAAADATILLTCTSCSWFLLYLLAQRTRHTGNTGLVFLPSKKLFWGVKLAWRSWWHKRGHLSCPHSCGKRGLGWEIWKICPCLRLFAQSFGGGSLSREICCGFIALGDGIGSWDCHLLAFSTRLGCCYLLWAFLLRKGKKAAWAAWDRKFFHYHYLARKG